MAAIDLATLRQWARIPHREDDPALAHAAEAAEAELENRTGWVASVGTRTQYVAAEPSNLLQQIEKQPCTQAMLGDVELDLVSIYGLTYAKMPAGTEYPCTLDLEVGGALPPVIRLLLLIRATQLVNERGDDRSPASGGYWDNVTAAMGRGIN